MSSMRWSDLLENGCSALNTGGRECPVFAATSLGLLKVAQFLVTSYITPELDVTLDSDSIPIQCHTYSFKYNAMCTSLPEMANRRQTSLTSYSILLFIPWSILLPTTAVATFDYRDAMSKSLLYFEAQRSGHLPHNQRVTWRGHSALTDGLEQGVDLVGGYYDAGDHVKFGLPMAFTITMLSWSVIEYGSEMSAAGEYMHALESIKWGTDYFVKAHTQPNVLWMQVGDGEMDHVCWQRPEDMTVRV